MTDGLGEAGRGWSSKNGLPAIREQILQARDQHRQLCLIGGNTKAFYGRQTAGEPLALSTHTGIVAYEPTELVLTARAGTRLDAIEAELDSRGQMLGFEPPRFGPDTTIGGIVAAGISGPARPYRGAVRDFVLGTRIMNGDGEILTFGGQVMKNVAGYDVSRLMVGAMGTLGLILEVSLRLLPKPERECSLAWNCDVAGACEFLTAFGRRPWPLSGVSFDANIVRARLSGRSSAVDQACRSLGPDIVDDGNSYWGSLRDHTLPFFQETGRLWRIAVPPACEPLVLSGRWYWDWGGALRWLRSDESEQAVRAAAAAAGGHAVLFRGDGDIEPFAPLSPVSLALHRRIKQTFDPAAMFNPGRMYREI